jgi:hypothetical protein
MRNACRLVGVAVFLLFVQAMSGCAADNTASEVQEQDIVACEASSECVLVPYSHCCGATKRGINRRYRALYEARPEWQSYAQPEVCATLGQCFPDTALHASRCVENRCQPAFWH